MRCNCQRLVLCGLIGEERATYELSEIECWQAETVTGHRSIGLYIIIGVCTSKNYTPFYHFYDHNSRVTLPFTIFVAFLISASLWTIFRLASGNTSHLQGSHHPWLITDRLTNTQTTNMQGWRGPYIIALKFYVSVRHQMHDLVFSGIKVVVLLSLMSTNIVYTFNDINCWIF